MLILSNRMRRVNLLIRLSWPELRSSHVRRALNGMTMSFDYNNSFTPFLDWLSIWESHSTRGDLVYEKPSLGDHKSYIWYPLVVKFNLCHLFEPKISVQTTRTLGHQAKVSCTNNPAHAQHVTFGSRLGRLVYLHLHGIPRARWMGTQLMYFFVKPSETVLQAEWLAQGL